MYVAEVLSCYNISRAHADAIPMCVVVSICMRISRHEASISRHKVGINMHDAHNYMRRRTSM
jgi:hypothetical protein